MSTAWLDRVLAILVVAMATTGLLSLRAGSPADGWVFTLHAVLGGSLFGATAVKLRRSVPRAVAGGRFGRLALGMLVSVGTMAALTGGFLWVASGELVSLGAWTVLTLHAWVGLVLVPLVILHLLPHRWRLLRPRRAAASNRHVSRRSLLAVGGLALAGVGLFGVVGLVDRLRGGERRFTGSRWLPSGGTPPVTTFFGEGAPSIDPLTWQLKVVLRDMPARTLSLSDLKALGETDLIATLDCTSGWAIETGWRGVSLATLLGSDAGADRGAIRITSVTGWSTVLPMTEARQALLATEVAGRSLARGNGGPCRLVVPDRRGLDWVKWVASIEVA
jgi:DMSO/TMAO reductase YedYZ molybdopterin-dependent catalytic subunit